MKFQLSLETFDFLHSAAAHFYRSNHKGSSNYDVHKKIGFLTPPPLSTCVHMGGTPSPLWTSTRGRHEIHTALLKWLVQRPTGPKAEIRLYDSNLSKLYY